MVANTTTIGNVTYSSTDTDTAVSLTDDAYGIVHAVSELIKSIDRLRGSLNK